MAIGVYLHFKHVFCVKKKLFPLVTALLISNDFNDRLRKANMFLAIITAPIYWLI